MTDEERFEELAYNVGISLDGEKALMSSDDYDFLYNYALEQAERVQELENENRILRTVAESNKYIGEQYLEQNKRYREAIEYVMTAKSTHYTSLENALEDIKFVINEALEGDLE